VDAILRAWIMQGQHIDVISPQAPQAFDDRTFDLFRPQPVTAPGRPRLRYAATQLRKRPRHCPRPRPYKAHRRRDNRPGNSEFSTDCDAIPAAGQEFSQYSLRLSIAIGRRDVVPGHAALERKSERPQPLRLGNPRSKQGTTKAQGRDFAAKAGTDDSSHRAFSRVFRRRPPVQVFSKTNAPAIESARRQARAPVERTGFAGVYEASTLAPT